MCTNPQNLLLVALCPIIGMPSLGAVGIVHFKDKKIKTWKPSSFNDGLPLSRLQ